MSRPQGSEWGKTVYRLRGFPSNFGREDLSKAVQEAYHVQPTDFKIHSLSLDVAEGYTSRQKVATITFRSKPIALHESKNQEWRFEIACPSENNADVYWAYLDTHFRGLTPLTPEKNDETCDADCVFVHGWSGNALGSLVADDPTYIWLRDDLPSRFPNLRIWTYGYGSKLTDENYVSDPFEDAEGLKGDLRSFRDPSEKERPIIFIVHSLGGLIFKQAMISMSKSNNVDDKQNMKLIIGALFFGVPGHGMDTTALASMVYGLPSQYTLNLLNEDVGFRQRDIQDEDFHRVWPDHGFNVISFFEKHKTPTVAKTANGWDRTGPLSLLVKPGSATSSRYNLQGSDNMIALDKDHSSMVKFSRNDQEDYRKVWKALRRLMDNAQSIVQGRVKSQSLSLEKQHELELQQSFIDDLYNQILQSRSRQVAEAANETYEWIFGDLNDQDKDEGAVDDQGRNSNDKTKDRSNEPSKNKHQDGKISTGDSSKTMERPLKKRRLNTNHSTGFSEWLRKGHGIYWVTGKPGSGKSTLIKFIARHPKTKIALQEWAGHADIVTASFYFWISGVSLQRSLIGLLQSIFHQILNQDRDLIQALFPREWRSTKQSKHFQWTEDSFMDAVDLLQDLKQFQQRKFCFFVDGLDEYHGEKNHDWLCDFLLRFSSLRHVKMCVSSRYWAVFQSAFSKCPTLRLHEWTRSDVDKFVSQELQEHALWPEVWEADRKQAELLIEEITQAAQGVFLWVFLTVRSLIKGLEKGDGIGQLNAKLKTMPKTLGGFFERMVKDLPDEDHDFAIKALLVVKAFSSPPLIFFSFLEDKDLAFRKNTSFHRDFLVTLRSMCIRTERQLTAICGDLLHLNSDDPNSGELGFGFGSSLTFVHRTLGDYLNSPAGLALLVLHNGSYFDVLDWYHDMVLQNFGKILPTVVARSECLFILSDLYRKWFRLFAVGSRDDEKLFPQFRYIEDLDRTMSTAFEAMSIRQRHWIVVLGRFVNRGPPFGFLESLATNGIFIEYLRAKLQQSKSLPDIQGFQRLFDSAISAWLCSCGMHPDTLTSRLYPDKMEVLEVLQQISYEHFQSGMRSEYFILESIPLIHDQEPDDCAFNLVKCEHSGKRSTLKTYRSCRSAQLKISSTYSVRGYAAWIRQFSINVYSAEILQAPQILQRPNGCWNVTEASNAIKYWSPDGAIHCDTGALFKVLVITPHSPCYDRTTT